MKPTLELASAVQWLIVVIGGGMILFILKEYFKHRKDTALTMKVDMIEKTNERDHTKMEARIAEVNTNMNKGFDKIDGRLDAVFKAIPKRASD